MGYSTVKMNWNQLHGMERRHRIFQDELPYLVKALAEEVETIQLEDLTHGKGKALFRVLWRIKEHRPGPPSYPEISEETVTRVIGDFTPDVCV